MKELESCFNAHVQEKRIAGASCVLFQEGKQIYKGLFGYADCAQTKPLKGKEIFRLASMTKPITAVAALICKERGLLDFDTPIGEYLDGFSHGGVGKIEGENIVFAKSAREITIRDILTHSSGLGSGEIGNRQFCAIKTPQSLEENASLWNGKFLDFATGERSAYSGVVAFELVARIVEKVSNKPFDSFLQEEIFLPLHMQDTCYLLNEEQEKRLAEICIEDGNGGLKNYDLGVRGFVCFALGYTGGSAGLFSTLDDYARFALMLAGGGTLDGVKILSKASVTEMATRYFDFWGLSVFVRGERTETQPLAKGCFGWSGAYGTHFWVDASRNFVAVLMLNHANCGGSGSPFSADFERLVGKVLYD